MHEVGEMGSDNGEHQIADLDLGKQSGPQLGAVARQPPELDRLDTLDR
jgi:hypothetical protein